MKAVIYHADSHFAWNEKPKEGFYQRLFMEAKENFRQHGISTIHLTINGFPAWGDENYFYEGDPRNVVANREEFFYQFLKDAPQDTYWFTEPDCRILEGIPGLPKKGLALCYRQGDDVPLTPSFRLATKEALPVFEELAQMMREDPRKDWHGDSAVFARLWNNMGKPTEKLIYKGVLVDIRLFRDYVKPGRYTINNMGPGKTK